LIFYSKALLRQVGTDGRDVFDEHGLPIVAPAMSQLEAIRASMQGLTHACYTFWPDTVLFVSAFFVEAGTFEVMRHRRHKLVMLHTESPYQDDEQLTRAPYADLNLLNDPANLAAYDALGTPALYMPHAYRPGLHYPRRCPVNPELASDFTFIGTAFRSRIEFFERMSLSGIDVLLGGSNWDEDLAPDSPLRAYLDQDARGCVANSDTAELYRNATMSLNLYRRESEDAHAGEGWAMGPREIEMAACGLPFLRDPRPESDQVLPMLPAFASPEDASEQLTWWLDERNTRHRDRAASLAREAVADRTFVNNAKRVLRALENL
jgi:hypothetical protein